MANGKVPPHHCCLMSGFILIAGIGIICVGVLVYKPYTEAKFYISTRCSIVETMKSTKVIYKGDDEDDEIVDCIHFAVVYDIPADVNTTDDIEATGYLSMNEASAGKEGSCYADDDGRPSCYKRRRSCTFECWINPRNRDHIVQYKKFTRAGVIHAFFWTTLLLIISIIVPLVCCLVKSQQCGCRCRTRYRPARTVVV